MKLLLTLLFSSLCFSVGYSQDTVTVYTKDHKTYKGLEVKFKYKGKPGRFGGGSIKLTQFNEEKIVLNFNQVERYTIGAWAFDMLPLYPEQKGKNEKEYSITGPYMKIFCHEEYTLYAQLELIGEGKRVGNYRMATKDRKSKFFHISHFNSIFHLYKNGEFKSKLRPGRVTYNGITAIEREGNQRSVLKMYFEKCDAVKLLFEEVHKGTGRMTLWALTLMEDDVCHCSE